MKNKKGVWRFSPCGEIFHSSRLGLQNNCKQKNICMFLLKFWWNFVENLFKLCWNNRKIMLKWPRKYRIYVKGQKDRQELQTKQNTTFVSREKEYTCARERATPHSRIFSIYFSVMTLSPKEENKNQIELASGNPGSAHNLPDEVNSKLHNPRRL